MALPVSSFPAKGRNLPEHSKSFRDLFHRHPSSSMDDDFRQPSVIRTRASIETSTPSLQPFSPHRRSKRKFPPLESPSSASGSDSSPLSSKSLPTWPVRDLTAQLSQDNPPSSFVKPRRPLPSLPTSPTSPTSPGHRTTRSASELPTPADDLTTTTTTTTHTSPNRDRPLPQIPLPDTSSPRSPISPAPRSSSLNRISHTSSSGAHEGRSFFSARSSDGRAILDGTPPPRGRQHMMNVPAHDLTTPITRGDSHGYTPAHYYTVARSPRQRSFSEAWNPPSHSGRRKSIRRPFRKSSSRDAATNIPFDDVVVVTTRHPTTWRTGVWEEKPVEDVIPKLRELRVSTKKWG